MKPPGPASGDTGMSAAANAAAAAWEKWSGWYDANHRPLADWFGQAVGARPGLAVLDVGCGAGFPALALAARVGPGGSVVATDLSPGMTAVVQRRARAAGLGNVTVRTAEASRLPFADASFDAVTCSAALMLCPDPAAAAVEMHRVLRPGGRLAVTVWAERARSPFFDVALTALAEVFSPPPAGTPGPFRLGAVGALEALLRDGGFADVSIDARPFEFACASPEEYAEAFTSLAVGPKQKLASAPPADAERIRAKLLAAARARVANGRLRLTATPLCAFGRKPLVEARDA